jgi:hypothetical protein
VNLLHVGKLFRDGASARSERHGIEALLGDGVHELEVDGVVDAPSFEGLFEQGAVIHGDSCCPLPRAERQKKRI